MAKLYRDSRHFPVERKSEFWQAENQWFFTFDLVDSAVMPRNLRKMEQFDAKNAETLQGSGNIQ